MDAASHPGRRNKVPEVTALFWIIKILCTTVGETVADYLNETLGFGLTNTTLVMGGGLVLVMWWQFRRLKYVPATYWLTVVLVSVVGTLVTDNLTDRRLASSHRDLQQDATYLGLHLLGHLVGVELVQRLALRDLFALGLEPADDRPGLHALAETRKLDLGRHDREALACLARARRLDGGVERQQIGLFGDVVDQPHEPLAALRRDSNELERIRGRRLALIPQNSGQSLTPNLRIEAQLAEVLALHGTRPAAEHPARVRELLAQEGASDEAVVARRLTYSLLRKVERERRAEAMAQAWQEPRQQGGKIRVSKVRLFRLILLKQLLKIGFLNLIMMVFICLPVNTLYTAKTHISKKNVLSSYSLF